MSFKNEVRDECETIERSNDHCWKHGALAGCAGYHTGKLNSKLYARAVIAGPGISGEAHVYQEYEGRVRIKLRLDGTPETKLKPGRHAIHIHETANCEPFSAAKGHYDDNVDPTTRILKPT